jgi:hypothetical protein
LSCLYKYFENKIIGVKNMSKILLAVAIIVMIMATGMLASAVEPKGTEAIVRPETIAVPVSEAEKGTEIAVTQSSQSSQSSGIALTKTQGNLGMVIGRYGPIDLCSGCSKAFRIDWGKLGSFPKTPIVTDSLEVDYLINANAVYSLGMDRGYTTTKRFDARLKSHSGSLTQAYIDYIAIR